jgi:phosphoserine aminotransferase
MTIPPLSRPSHPYFGSGPACKYPTWSSPLLEEAFLSRSHRSAEGVKVIRGLLEKTHAVLGLPTDAHVALVGGGATGAMEMLLWNLLGPRKVIALIHDVFSDRWGRDILGLMPEDRLEIRYARPGALPSLVALNPNADMVLNWNGSTSGCRYQDGDWLTSRDGLVIVDVTSAAFTMDIPWEKIDAAAFSWQKGLGSEGAHGMIVLRPRAFERLQRHTPFWPVPYLYRLKEMGDHPQAPLFEGKTLNTPSLLCVEDFFQALSWAESIGGIATLCERSRQNLRCVEAWADQQDTFTFLTESPLHRSSSTICLVPKDPRLARLSLTQQGEWFSGLAHQVKDVAVDILNHPSAPAGLRLWGGATIDPADMALLLPWVTWAANRQPLPQHISPLRAC